MDVQTHADIIKLFGSGPALARAIGQEPHPACHWLERGIPAKHWHLVERACAARGHTITAAMLAVMPRTSDAKAA
jgi:hypothetical protein